MVSSITRALSFVTITFTLDHDSTSTAVRADVLENSLIAPHEAQRAKLYFPVFVGFTAVLLTTYIMHTLPVIVVRWVLCRSTTTERASSAI